MKPAERWLTGKHQLTRRPQPYVLQPEGEKLNPFLRWSIPWPSGQHHFAGNKIKIKWTAFLHGQLVATEFLADMASCSKPNLSPHTLTGAYLEPMYLKTLPKCPHIWKKKKKKHFSCISVGSDLTCVKVNRRTCRCHKGVVMAGLCTATISHH